MIRNGRLLCWYDVFYKPLSIVLLFVFLYCGAALLFPYTGSVGVVYGVVLLLLFVLFFLLFSLCMFGVGAPLISGRRFRFAESGSSVLPFVFSIVGIAFLVVDKVYFRGIDFFNMSPAEIRNKISSESGGGVSSIFSLIGNVLQCFVVVAAFNSVFKDSGFRFFIMQALFLTIVFASSYLLGGRTPLLTYLVIIFSVYILSGRAASTFAAAKFMLPAIFVALAFALTIFSLRARAIGIESSEYLSAMLLHLGAANVESSLAEEGGAFRDGLNYFYVVVAYLIHPFWVSSEIALGSGGGGSVSFYTLQFLLSKFIYIDLSSAKHAYYQLFSSLPGGLYYDYGFVGVLLYSFFLAVVGYVGVVVLVLSRGRAVVGRMLIVFCLATLLLSPLLHSLNFVFFLFYMSVLFGYAFYKDLLCLLFFLLSGEAFRK